MGGGTDEEDGGFPQAGVVGYRNTGIIPVLKKTGKRQGECSVWFYEALHKEHHIINFSHLKKSVSVAYCCAFSMLGIQCATLLVATGHFPTFGRTNSIMIGHSVRANSSLPLQLC